MRLTFRIGLALAAAAIAAAPAAPASAGLFGRHAHHEAQAGLPDKAVAQIQKALDEQRYVDAGRMIDEAVLSGVKDPRLALMSGQLALGRGQYDTAIVQFKLAEADHDARAKALEGEGLALSLLGRSDEALHVLQDAVTADPSSWRAWNALGSEYDQRGDFTRAETAYEHALVDSDNAAMVLNNRGYSRLLRQDYDRAVDDFVDALKKKPDMAPARTNLRLALAMKGEYDRALQGGSPADQAALLNNAGFAAMTRGDYSRAEQLFEEAIKAKGEYYAKAAANLETARAMAARSAATPVAAAASPAPAPAVDAPR
ncbi:MAG TPA: tetratricopeptide repeat protein [Caulobacteraceae bacterium]|nr:tetratricopeptide repeat protein [Caulobacteraceae bacterium]